MLQLKSLLKKIRPTPFFFPPPSPTLRPTLIHSSTQCINEKNPKNISTGSIFSPPPSPPPNPLSNLYTTHQSKPNNVSTDSVSPPSPLQQPHPSRNPSPPLPTILLQSQLPKSTTLQSHPSSPKHFNRHLPSNIRPNAPSNLYQSTPLSNLYTIRQLKKV